MDTIVININALIVIVLFVLGIIGALFGLLNRKIDKVDDRLRIAESAIGILQARFTWFASLQPSHETVASLMYKQSSEGED